MIGTQPRYEYRTSAAAVHENTGAKEDSVTHVRGVCAHHVDLPVVILK